MTDTVFVPGPKQLEINDNDEYLTRAKSKVAALTNGGYVVTWQQTYGLDTHEIWVQQFNADGTEETVAVRVNSTTADEQELPQIAVLNGGSYVVTWQSDNQDGDQSGIYMQRFDAAGTPLGGETLVNTSTVGEQFDSHVYALNNNGYVVAWSDYVDNGDGTFDVGVKFQRYNSAGTPSGGEEIAHVETVPADPTYGWATISMFETRVIQLTGGRIAVAWTRYDDGYTTQVSIFASNGVQQAGPITLERGAGDEYTMPQQDMVSLGNGNFLVVHDMSFEATGEIGVGYGEIYGEILDLNLNVVVPRFIIADGVANRRSGIFVSSDGNGGALVGYVQEANDSISKTTLVQQIDENGVLFGSPSTAFVHTGRNYGFGDVAVLSSGDAVVVGQTSGDGADSEIMYRILGDGEDVRFTSGADTVVLGAGGEVVAGLEGADDITGGDGDDWISGGSGGDTIRSGRGNDVLHGGDTVDILNGQANDDLIFGDDGEDIISGSSGYDVLDGGRANDDIDGGTDDDVIYGGDGSDVITGGEGNDYIYGHRDSSHYLAVLEQDDRDEGETNTLSGEEGEDRIFGGSGADIIDGGEGDDILNGGSSNLYPTGDDTFIASNGDDIIYGGDGEDVIDYTAINRGFELFDDSRGQGTVEYRLEVPTVGLEIGFTQRIDDVEIIIGTNFADTFNGLSLNDEFRGGLGDDTLLGLDGDDTLDGGGGADSIDGGGGTNDTADYSRSISGVQVSLSVGAVQTGGDADGDTLLNIENLIGSASDDTLTGNSARNTIDGSEGNDTLSGGGQIDTINGGDGDDIISGGQGIDVLDGGNDDLDGDTVSYTVATGGVTVNLLADTMSGGGNGNNAEVVLNFENVDGSLFRDTLTGDGRANTLKGNLGRDTLDGGNGDDDLQGGGGIDTLLGGLGDDNLSGGAGADKFYFNISGWDNDIITDFADGSDKIDLDGLVFADVTLSILGAGTLVTYGIHSIEIQNVSVLNITAADFV